MKPMILARELGAPHVLAIIDTRSEWYYSIHPERYVPALRDRDPATGEDAIVFEGTACLQYLADRFDTNGDWTGRTAAEKAAVMSWTEYQTAGIGYVPGVLRAGGKRKRKKASVLTECLSSSVSRATAKYWLYFLRGYPTRANPIQLPRTIEKYVAREEDKTRHRTSS